MAEAMTPATAGVRAAWKGCRVSAQKARLIANMIRGLGVDEANGLLQFVPQKSAGLIHKVLKSATANAENNHGLDADDLYVAEIRVDEGRTMKRMRARARGRGNQILKRACHISMVLRAR